MGIFDFMYSSTDYLKRNAPDLTPVKDACRSTYGYGRTAVNTVRDNAVIDRSRRMGVSDFMYSSTDYLKRNAPDLTPVKDACRSSYGYGCTAVNAVRCNVDTVIKYYPDGEAQAKFVRIGTKIVQNAALYGFEEYLKCVPGRIAFDKIVMPAIRDEMAPPANKKNTAEKESGGCRKSLEPPKIVKEDKDLASENAPRRDSSENKKPEDVIPIFINGSVGRNTFDDLIVPVTGRGKKQQ
ncbi:uncharacterized protein LOC132307731 isoform X2 [Cornus florida]|uniref:uncharacterized protein LOC132307731 isoform X2 n=1 Tax=Cornus florida TaxID=4283 RepID=UPI0028A03D68|nr:uncharacterized protein LOC132307731 isoform X2 [Cornus florida]